VTGAVMWHGRPARGSPLEERHHRNGHYPAGPRAGRPCHSLTRATSSLVDLNRIHDPVEGRLEITSLTLRHHR
jgi:hypothetical protein